MAPEVRIEGIGVVSPLGIGFPQLSTALIDGASLQPAPGQGCATPVSSDLTAWFDSPKTYLDPGSALCLAAAALARREAGWDSAEGAPPAERCGIALGTAYGCPESMLRFWQSVEEKGPRLANPLFFTHSYPNTPASVEAIEHGLQGPHLTLCQGTVSGTLALGAALDALRLGKAYRMLAGGFDSAVADGASTASPHAEAAVILALGTNAGGMLPGRGRPRLLGTGSAGFLPGERAEPGILQAMDAALSDAGHLRPALVVLAVPGPPELQAAEARAVLALSGRLGVSFTCTAGAARFGPPSGVSGLLGLLVALIAMKEEWILDGGSEGLQGYELLDIAHEPEERAVSVALVNSIDPAGAVASVVVDRG